ncbi:LPS export ABC transporter permease LptG [Pleomorphomonas diazotrophica]|uniref:LPS export ABC transporter permease LptG n=1 Tax=Pleomorphomonas diazotrophica TaxID=1166257 RepID=A0A1I4U7F8_9HYPH|nr:LPS export ABC transporter permease LptG [Pleomorphomonas diazotrophica]PKR91213.1 LPS export ABC transporter permease LptG [Pleomorphomonas diazotrophica]SFM84924.1 lipopolysaccharide export system permease protein [Pleomorphomonas diazotrophica]
MIGRSLGTYFTLRFAGWILGVFIGISVLVFLIDAIEVLRSTGGRDDISVPLSIAASALRVPALMEQVLPFAVLLGSIAAFVTLSRGSELMIVRAAGLSVWQFMMPALVFALALGIVASVIYNPLSTLARNLSSEILVGSRASVMTTLLSGSATPSWTRQRTGDGNAVLHTEGVSDGGRTILQPVFWVFGADGMLAERVEARIGQIEPGRWNLSEVTVTQSSGVPKHHDHYFLPTALTAEQVAGGLGSPDSISFWQLPDAIAQARASSLPANRFSLQYQSLLARPLLLASMVLIAATVSLGFARYGGGEKMILGGVVAGFVLYVVIEVARSLGSEGLVSPVLAAWAPSVVAILLGSTVLLFREDG